MALQLSNIIVLATFMAPVLGFCGSHTHLSKRAEAEGGVEVNTFGYFGDIVSGSALWFLSISWALADTLLRDLQIGWH